jgi:hypothetical protein
VRRRSNNQRLSSRLHLHPVARLGSPLAHPGLGRSSRRVHFRSPPVPPGSLSRLSPRSLPRLLARSSTRCRLTAHAAPRTCSLPAGRSSRSAPRGAPQAVHLASDPGFSGPPVPVTTLSGSHSDLQRPLISTTSTTLYRLPTCSARLGSVCSARRPPRRRSALTPPRFAPLNFTSRSLPDPKVSSIPLCSASPLLSRRTARLHCVLLGFTPLNFTSRSLPDPKVDSIPLCSASLRSTSHRALSPTRKSARSRSARLHFTVSKSCSVSLCFAQLRLRRPEELLGFTSLHSASLRYLEELLGFTSLGSTSLSRRTAPFCSALLSFTLCCSALPSPSRRTARLRSAPLGPALSSPTSRSVRHRFDAAQLRASSLGSVVSTRRSIQLRPLPLR